MKVKFKIKTLHPGDEVRVEVNEKDIVVKSPKSNKENIYITLLKK